ncbi:MAG: ABC transporter substrate-binding protein [Candidatus Binatia bacterium]
MKGTSKRIGSGALLVVTSLFLFVFTRSPISIGPQLAKAAEVKAPWQIEWENALTAAEKEGQVTVYGPPGRQYQDAIGSFGQAYPKIKLNYLPGSGTDNSQRLLTERRAGMYLADVFVSGSGSAVVLYKANVFDPIPPILVLPENKDQSAWFMKKHQHADPKNQFVFIMAGNVNSNIAAYNSQLVNPDEIKSFWDVLKPKWKGKIVAYDPKARGHIQTMRGIYYNRNLGGEFIRKLFSEMDVTVGRDQRLLMDWVANGKFHLYLFATSSDAEDAKKKGLRVGVAYAPPEESHMSAGFGHLMLVNKAPHPNAAKVFANWLLSREGQIQWQKKSDNNSLRIDIPKDMLSDPRSVPKEGGRYLNASLPEYEDITPILKIVEEATAKTGKK